MNHSIDPFTGKPRYRSTVMPSRRQQAGRIPRRGIEWLLFGQAVRVAIPDSYTRRVVE